VKHGSYSGIVLGLVFLLYGIVRELLEGVNGEKLHVLNAARDRMCNGQNFGVSVNGDCIHVMCCKAGKRT